MIRALKRHWNARAEAWLNRHHPRRDGEYQINRRRVYILPTRAGAAYGIVTIIVLLAAMNYSNAVAFMLAFWLGAIGFVAMHETHGNLLGLGVRLSTPDAVFAGETAYQPVSLHNHSRRARVSLSAHEQRHPKNPSPVDCVNEAQTLMAWKPEGRGVHPVPRVAISTNWPLGVFCSWSWVHGTVNQVVYPAPAKESLNLPEAPAEPAPGSLERPSDEELSGLRDYVPGDSPRNIHWRSLAAHDQLASKRFSTPAADAQWLDISAYPASLTTEEKLSQLCRAVLDMHAAQQPFGMRLGPLIFDPASGDQHRDHCLEALARYV